MNLGKKLITSFCVTFCVCFALSDRDLDWKSSYFT